jgi:hypothetical protein
MSIHLPVDMGAAQPPKRAWGRKAPRPSLHSRPESTRWRYGGKGWDLSPVPLLSPDVPERLIRHVATPPASNAADRHPWRISQEHQTVHLNQFRPAVVAGNSAALRFATADAVAQLLAEGFHL